MHKKILPYLLIIRPVNLAIIILTQLLLRFFVIGKYFALNAVTPMLGYADLAILILSTVLIAAGGYIINDYYDQQVDQINKARNILIRSEFPVSNALIYYRIITLIGIGGGFYIAWKVDHLILGLIFPAVALMLWFYSSVYQKTVLIGNIIISLLSALVILVYWTVEFFALKTNTNLFVEMINQLPLIHVIVTAYALFAFLVSLVREIVKDAEDVSGDRAGGYSTFAVKYGLKKTRQITIAIHLMAIFVLGFYQVLLYHEGLMYIFWYILVTVQVLMVYVFFQLIAAQEKKDFHFLSNAYKFIMLTGILSMQLLYIS